MTLSICPYCFRSMNPDSKHCPKCEKKVEGKVITSYEQLKSLNLSFSNQILVANSKIDFLEEEVRDLNLKLEKIMKHLNI
jgi:predicted amidophosphoribosyltransferase